MRAELTYCLIRQSLWKEESLCQERKRGEMSECSLRGFETNIVTGCVFWVLMTDYNKKVEFWVME